MSKKERIVTDSVHERLRERSYNFCEACKERIDGTMRAMEQHFDSKHEPSYPCAYCHGKVFNYILRRIDPNNGSETSVNEIFHNCPRQKQ